MRKVVREVWVCGYIDYYTLYTRTLGDAKVFLRLKSFITDIALHKYHSEMVPDNSSVPSGYVL